MHASNWVEANNNRRHASIVKDKRASFAKNILLNCLMNLVAKELLKCVICWSISFRWYTSSSFCTSSTCMCCMQLLKSWRNCRNSVRRTGLAVPVYPCPSLSDLLLPQVTVFDREDFELAFWISDDSVVTLIGFVAFMTCWNAWNDASYHFRPVSNRYVADSQHTAKWTSKFEGE